jgi:hypothetical protein
MLDLLAAMVLQNLQDLDSLLWKKGEFVHF